MANLTPKQKIAKKIADQTEFDYETLLKENNTDQLKDLLADLDDDTLPEDDIAEDGDNQQVNEGHAAQEENEEENWLEAIIIEDKKPKAVFNNGDKETLKYRSDVRDYVIEKTRDVKVRLNMVNKPNKDEEKTQNALELYWTNMIKTVLDVNAIDHAETQRLLLTHTDRQELLDCPGFSMATIKKVVGYYCELNKIKGLE